MEKQHAVWTVALVALVSGLLFGIGLSLSEMINPQRVLGFLDVTGSWDPTLAFVMGGALLVSFPAYQLARKIQQPVCSNQFHLPTGNNIDFRLVLGATMFGAGWGLAGFCPGPALAALITLQMDVLIFVTSMIVGMLIYQWWNLASKKS